MLRMRAPTGLEQQKLFIQALNRLFVLKDGSKKFTAHEGENLQEITELEHLFEATPRVENEGNRQIIDLDFGHFWTEQFWENALIDANNADLIVISLSGGSDLPIPVQRWMEAWPHYQLSDKKRLMVVFTAEEAKCPKRAALIAYFRKVASLHGLEFINDPVSTNPVSTRRATAGSKLKRFPRETDSAYSSHIWNLSRLFQTAVSLLAACIR
jgi:hypothetical protein